jgi:prepilin-type N-terminal cleavage/methylation domain-containing protein
MIGSLKKKIKINQEKGFTLLEITVAVAILGVGLTTLIAAQANLINRYLEEKRLFQASLYAQYLMTFIELDNNPPELGTKTDRLYSELNEHGYFKDLKNKNLRKEIKDWTVKKTVTPFDFLEYEDIMRRIDLEISWGNKEGSYSIVYYKRPTQNNSQ